MWPRTRELPTRFAPSTHWRLFPRDDKMLPRAAATAARVEAIAGGGVVGPHHRHSTARARARPRMPVASASVLFSGPGSLPGALDRPTRSAPAFQAVSSNPWVEPACVTHHGPADTDRHWHVTQHHHHPPLQAPPRPFRRIQSSPKVQEEKSTRRARVTSSPQVRVKTQGPASVTDVWPSVRPSSLRAIAPVGESQDAPECELPMDMECGCKTRREKEQREKEALTQAAAKKRQEERMQAMVTSSDSPVAAMQEKHEQPEATSNTIDMVTRTDVKKMQSSFHRRHLPQDCIAFSSPEGRKLFMEAINSPTNYMQIYFPLAEQFITQAEPAFCGLATLAMCLNALQIDPGRLWKGPWRWFSEELFDCCTSLSVAKEKGISMSEFICLARCNGVLTDDTRATEDFSLEQFRAIVKRSCATSSEIVVLNYSRKVLGQTGDGHFSPIGGYHAERDMVLLMDVARFKYPPHWVSLSRVYQAMQRVDASIGLPRGLVVLKENAHATGPTLVKQQLIHCDEQAEAPVAPASQQPCCYSASAVEAARRMADAVPTIPATKP